MTKEQEDYCAGCRNAKADYCEYYGGYKQWFFDHCEKDLEPVWNEEEECFECEARRDE